MSLVIHIFHCYFIVYYYILGVHQLIDWPSLVYSPRLCEIRVLSAKSCTQFMCLIINHFVMYCGEWGKQVGSMDEESQVRGCYNITFIWTPTRKQCRLFTEMNTGRNSKQTTRLCRDTGGKGTLPAQCTGFNTIDNWGHKTPTQSKRKRTRRKRL